MKKITTCTVYNEKAYEALALSSWLIFRKPKLQTQAYPILGVGAVLSIACGIYNYKSEAAIYLLLLSVFFIAAFPFSGVAARKKMYKTAIEHAKSNGDFPSTVEFQFDDKLITSISNNIATKISYEKIQLVVKMKNWIFLFFEQNAAYIINTNNFERLEQLEEFEKLITEKSETQPIEI